MTGLTWLAGACATVQDVTGIGGGSALDTNEDGVISKAEAADDPALAAVFDDVDTNNDQNINPRELSAAQTTIAEADFDGLDFNDDGVISEREADGVRPSLRERFAEVDADGDGNVSRSEYDAARLNLLRQTEFAAFDTDGDGVIDKSEADDNPGLKESFRSVDIDDDKLISGDEFERMQSR